MVLCIPSKMAALAKGSATLWIGMGFVVIHVCDRQDNLAARFGMRLTVGGSATWVHRRTFAGIAGSLDQ